MRPFGKIKPIHLLGMIQPSMLREYAKCTCVRSIDTSFPCAVALQGTRMTAHTLKPKGLLDYEASCDMDKIHAAGGNVQLLQKLGQRTNS